MNLPSPSVKYDPQNEAALRRALEDELRRVNAQLQAIRDALRSASALPIDVRT